MISAALTYARPIATPRQQWPIAAPNLMGPRIAMAETIADYLLSLRFTVHGGASGEDAQIELTEVRSQWPAPGDELPYPCASLIDRTPTSQGDTTLVPRFLEDTMGVFDCVAGFPEPPTDGEGAPLHEGSQTCLMKEAEAIATFQLDFFTSSAAHREAIEAGLARAFSPTEIRYGVLLGGHPRYWDRPVRATLIDTSYADTAAAVYANERRLRCVVRAECDIVSLRRIRVLDPRACVEVTDPSDPPEEPVT